MTEHTNGGHGSSIYEALEERQLKRFASLENILQEGFEKLAEELKKLREQGYIPLDVHNKMMDQYKSFITIIVKALCTVMVLLVVWVTGLKYFLPQ